MKSAKPKKASAPLSLKGWKNEKNSITKKFTFKDFEQAFSFMMRASIKINRLDHHPAWANVYNKVDVTLTTHDAGDVTEKDIKLAEIMDEIAKKLNH